jgi:hypothetical protein
VRDEGNGQISIKLLTQPNRSWVDNRYGKVPDGASMTFAGRRNYLPGAYDGLFDTNDYIRRDPHSYLNGNTMSISESVTRATDRVYSNSGWWGVYDDDAKGEKKDLAKVVKKIIKDGKGRDEVYRLGGKAKSLRKDGFGRYSLVKLFELAALLDGTISEPVLG